MALKVSYVESYPSLQSSLLRAGFIAELKKKLGCNLQIAKTIIDCCDTLYYSCIS